MLHPKTIHQPRRVGLLDLEHNLRRFRPILDLHILAIIMGAIEKRQTSLRGHRVQLCRKHILEHPLALNLSFRYPLHLHRVSDRDHYDAG